MHQLYLAPRKALPAHRYVARPVTAGICASLLSVLPLGPFAVTVYSNDVHAQNKPAPQTPQTLQIAVMPVVGDVQLPDETQRSELQRNIQAAIEIASKSVVERVALVNQDAIRTHIESARSLGISCIAVDVECDAKIGILAEVDWVIIAALHDAHRKKDDVYIDIALIDVRTLKPDNTVTSWRITQMLPQWDAKHVDKSAQDITQIGKRLIEMQQKEPQGAFYKDPTLDEKNAGNPKNPDVQNTNQNNDGQNNNGQNNGNNANNQNGDGQNQNGNGQGNQGDPRQQDGTWTSLATAGTAVTVVGGGFAVIGGGVATTLEILLRTKQGDFNTRGQWQVAGTVAIGVAVVGVVMLGAGTSMILAGTTPDE